jgi:mono/diheme cytochrome c family protein/plastocyanin
MNMENTARIIALLLVFGVSIVVVATRWTHEDGVVEIHAAMPEKGGWLPTNLTTKVNEPLHLRLISDDVVHGFALGQSDLDPVDILPGKATDITLHFDQPGTYTFYCTRWCGANHWRMRGTITVEGDTSSTIQDKVTSPLYLDLGIDLDAPHDLPELNLERLPSADRGQLLGIGLPDSYLSRDYYLFQTPSQAWIDLRSESFSNDLNDSQVWDLVALIWSAATTDQSLNLGKELYSQNCAACHGVDGRGDGVFALDPSVTQEPDSLRNEVVHPPDFTDPSQMYGTSPALLQGKIIRGGMGTGMPSWGQIFSEDQTWSLVSYLWSFSFEDLKE